MSDADAGRLLPVIQSGGDTGGVPVFDKVAIVGLGLIGGSIALAARQLWPSSLVIGVDNKDVLERAMVHHAIDVAAEDLVVMSGAQLIVLAAPVRQNIELLEQLDEYIDGPAIVTDVGSTKREISERARCLPDRLTFVGGHPLGGAPRSGIDYARADLFRGRPWLFTPSGDGVGVALERLEAFVRALGAEPHVMSPQEHDRLLAYLSHVPQLVASALMHLVGGAVGAGGLSLSGRGLVDTTRLASSQATIWRDICSTNGDEIEKVLDTLIEELEALKSSLHEGAELDRIFDSAVSWRRVLAKIHAERNSSNR